MADKIVLEIFKELEELHIAKDADYAGGIPLSNFRRCEQFGIPAWKGCLVRMSDKWSRLLSLVAKDGEHQVAGEGIKDTLKDLAVYSIIVLALLRHTALIEEPDLLSDGVLNTREEAGRAWQENEDIYSGKR
jgi:hypothetical protein